MYSLENIIAFDGVATGITKPILVPTVIGIINNIGSIQSVIASEVDIGNNNTAVAVLLITSPAQPQAVYLSVKDPFLFSLAFSLVLINQR